jgi:FAD/FMN-containing dehydrogenase
MEAFLADARALLTAAQVLTTDLAAYSTDWRGKFSGKPLAVLRPADTAEVAASVALCARHGVAIVPQGGHTGMCGGATPDASGHQVVLSLARLNRVRAVDPLNNTMTVEAGCILQQLQALAASHDRLFPLSLGAEGSCQIGGNLATNAGGVQVIRYGNTRDLVLGLEVVLPDGRVLNLLRALRKDNTGYDLKQLFIGSEGTLGIITAAVLKLFPATPLRCVVMAAVQSPQAALQLLGLVRGALGERLSAFELVSDACVSMVRQHFAATPALFDPAPPWCVLMQASDAGEQATLDAAVESALEAALAQGLVDNVVLARSEAQARQLWALREQLPEAQERDGSNIKHDIAVPVSAVPAFIAEVLPLLQQAHAGVRPIVFGHLGDGNLHFNVSRPAGWTTPAWLAETDRVNAIVLDAVARHQGSFSAEHGLGQLKAHELALYKSPLEIEMMQRVKQALDPQGLMNPGKLLPLPPADA